MDGGGGGWPLPGGRDCYRNGGGGLGAAAEAWRGAGVCGGPGEYMGERPATGGVVGRGAVAFMLPGALATGGHVPVDSGCDQLPAAVPFPPAVAHPSWPGAPRPPYNTEQNLCTVLHTDIQYEYIIHRYCMTRFPHFSSPPLTPCGHSSANCVCACATRHRGECRSWLKRKENREPAAPATKSTRRFLADMTQRAVFAGANALPRLHEPRRPHAARPPCRIRRLVPSRQG